MAVAPVTSGSAATGVNKFAALSSESFVRIMTAELTNQDPLKPNDSSHILEQMSSLRQIESSTTLTTKLDQLVTQNQFSAASSLLGATVSGVAEDGTRQVGTAVSIVRTNKGALLVLDSGQRVPVNNIDGVELPAYDPTPTPNTPTPNTPTTPVTPVAQTPLSGWQPVTGPARGVSLNEPGLQTPVVSGTNTGSTIPSIK